jgi:hypothetical protein
LVAGELIDPGSNLGTVLIKLPGTYTHGASFVYLRTKIGGIDPSIALATSGQTEIDYTAALYDVDNPHIGNDSTVEYFGFTANTAPNKLFATSQNVISSQLGISTGGVRGISTGGVRGISTGGVRGISTGGVRGISTGGVRGISTGGVRGISTGGVRGISTGGVRGISTGGVRGISTGGVRGISTGGVR